MGDRLKFTAECVVRGSFALAWYATKWNGLFKNYCISLPYSFPHVSGNTLEVWSTHHPQRTVHLRLKGLINVTSVESYLDICMFLRRINRTLNPNSCVGSNSTWLERLGPVSYEENFKVSREGTVASANVLWLERNFCLPILRKATESQHSKAYIFRP